MLNVINRNGIKYYSYNGIEKVQKQLLTTLKIIDKICIDNGLSYYLESGSALGAIRHGGFIPWDDDLDIGLLKPDYIKLIRILSDLKKGCYLVDENLENHCSSYFGLYKNLFIKNQGRLFHSLIPIRVDIRPMNIIKDTEESYSKSILYRNIANYLIFNRCDKKYEKASMLCYVDEFGSSKKKFFDYYNYSYGFGEGLDLKKALFEPPYLEFSTYTRYKYDDLFPTKKIKFEDLETYVSHSDYCLRDIYGDYNLLPDLKNRKPEGYSVCKFDHPQLIYNNSNVSFIDKCKLFLHIQVGARDL